MLEIWCRFLDDCETLLDKTKIDPMETSDKELPLLDLLIGRNDGKIWMDIYFKPTDTRRCFLFLSRTIVRKIYVLLQHRELVENQQEKLRHLSELKESLKYEYPVNIKINGILRKPQKSKKMNLRRKTRKQTNEV